MLISESLIIECDRAVRTARSGDPRLGLDLARRAYRQARAEGTQSGLLLALNALALCQSTNGAYIEAVATAIDAFRLASQLGDGKAAVDALTTLAGASNFILATSDVAMQMLDRCLERAIALGDSTLEVRVRNVRGVNYAQAGRFEEAEAEYLAAIAMMSLTEGTTPPALVIGNLANLAVKRAAAAPESERAALSATAEARIEEAMAIAIKEHSKEAEVRIYYNRGLFRMHEGRYEEAIESFKRGLDLAILLNHKSRIIDSYIEMGSAYMALGQYDEAVAAFEAAYTQADAQRPSRQLQVACERLAIVYDQLDRSREAAHTRAVFEREKAEFERESVHARRELTSFWQEIGATPAN
jgi:tetratricopeptide (TPR) repeat protein